ncbi:MAG: hypothetical protein WCF57_08565 [Pyrinomonadaceae bacterium]
MKQLDREELFINSYLLGKLDEQQQQQLEERFLTSPEFKERVLVAEDQLFEDYLANLLPEDDRERFARRFLSSPRYVQKLELFKALDDYAAAHAPQPVSSIAEKEPSGAGRVAVLGSKLKRSSMSRLAWAAMLLVVMFLALWWLMDARRSQQERAVLKQELAQLNNQQGGGSLNNTSHPPSSILSIKLIPLLTRSEGASAKITIPADTHIAQLQLRFVAGDYQSYRATLQRNEGDELFTLNGLQATATGEGKMVILNIPARLLTNGDYQLQLRGVTGDGRVEEISEYPFRVVSQ